MLRKIRLAAALFVLYNDHVAVFGFYRNCAWLVWLDGENTVPSCRAGIECGGGDSPCFVDSAFGACLLFGYSVR